MTTRLRKHSVSKPWGVESEAQTRGGKFKKLIFGANFSVHALIGQAEA